jgi:phosphatidylglycerophosphate synthase
MERYGIIAPALVGAGFWALSCGYFTVCWMRGNACGTTVDRRTHSRFFAFFMQYFLWLIAPVERALQRSGVGANSITLASVGVSMGSGVALASGRLGLAGWLLIASGGLDVLDGRLARARNLASPSGAFLDSVSDRWSELFVFAGFAYFLQDSRWLAACLLAAAGSVMVSYTRAVGEAAGIALDGGTMQRPERLTVISIGALFGAWFDAIGDQAIGTHIVGAALLVVGLGASITAVRRFRRGYLALAAADGQHEERSA